MYVIENIYEFYCYISYLYNIHHSGFSLVIKSSERNNHGVSMFNNPYMNRNLHLMIHAFNDLKILYKHF